MVHTSPVVLNQEMELQILDWVHGQKNNGFFVYTHNIIAKVLQINLEFKVSCVNSIRWWIYRFLQRHKLALRRPPRVSQHVPAQAEAICESFAQSSRSHILMNDIPCSLFVNIDKTAIYFIPRTLLLPMDGSDNFSVRCGTSSSQSARFASILLLMEGIFLYLLFLSLEKMAVLQGTCIRFFQQACMDASSKNLGRTIGL